MIPPEYLAYYLVVPIGFTEQRDMVLLAPTLWKKRQVEVIATINGD